MFPGKLKGFHELTVSEVAGLTGLAAADAELARARDYDEPFLLSDMSVLEARPGGGPAVRAEHRPGRPVLSPHVGITIRGEARASSFFSTSGRWAGPWTASGSGTARTTSRCSKRSTSPFSSGSRAGATTQPPGSQDCILLPARGPRAGTPPSSTLCPVSPADPKFRGGYHVGFSSERSHLDIPSAGTHRPGAHGGGPGRLRPPPADRPGPAHNARRARLDRRPDHPGKPQGDPLSR